MQIHTNREVLAGALALASGSTDKQGTMPILANVLITGNSRGLEIAATDLEVCFSGVWKAEVTHEGTVCVKAAALSKMLDAMPKKSELTLTSMEKHGLEIRQGKTRYELYGDDAAQFPPIPVTEAGAGEVVLDAEVIREMITKTAFSQSGDDLQYHLAGIFWETIEVADKSLLRLASTDGHRLTVIDRPCHDSLDLGEGILIPSKGIREINRILKGKGDVHVSLAPKLFTMRTEDGLQISIRLMDKKFPDYRRILPKKELVQIALSVNRCQFIDALTKVSKISTDRFKGAVLKVDGKYLEISFENPEIGRAVEDMGVKWVKGKGAVTMGFNIPYLLQPLSHMKSDVVLMQNVNEGGPWQFTGADDPGYMAIVMPMSF